MSTSDLITAGENLYTEIAGSDISTTVAANINDAGTVLSLVVSLASRNITSVDVDGIVTGATEVITGVTTVIKSAKKQTATAAATTTTTA